MRPRFFLGEWNIDNMFKTLKQDWKETITVSDLLTFIIYDILIGIPYVTTVMIIVIIWLIIDLILYLIKSLLNMKIK